MALIIKDRIKETTTTTGLGSVVLDGTEDTFLPFSEIGVGNTTYYAIVARGNDKWEVGTGTVGSGTLSRDIVLASSHANNKVDFSAGTKDVFVTLPADKIVSKDGAGIGTVTSVSASGGTGISVSGSPITSSGELVITNTAPDQVVSLTGGANVTVSGAYPNFTISAASGATGTITSVSVVSANGLAGTVTNPTSTPAITLSTTASGLLKGNAGALEAATASDVPELPQSKITNLTSDLAAKAPLASPALSGSPTAPTAAVGTNTTQIATTAFVNAEIANDAPTKTGGGASGTWGINVTGSAGSVDFNNLTNKGSGTGTYATTGDMRAPIFYDANNTAYYLDPANTGTSMAVAGNVGIGTTSPDGKLMVVANGAYNGSVASRTAIQIDNTNTTGGFTNSRIQWTWGGVGIGVKGYIEGGTYGNDYLGFGFNTTEVMRIAASGKVLVGAGATASLGDFVVSKASSGIAAIALESQGSWNGSIELSPTGNMSFKNNAASERLRLDPYGNVLAYGPMFSTIYYDIDNTAYYLNPANTTTSGVFAGGGGFGITATMNYTDYGRFVVAGGQAGTSTSSIALYTQGIAQGERADIALYSTFVGTGDNAPRRTADIIAGFNGGAWGNEYLSFNVGSNDSRVVTSEKMRIQSDGNVGIGRSPDTGVRLDVSGGIFRLTNEVGGNYGGDFRIVNSSAGATNGTKNFRISPIGTLEIINSAYNSIPFSFFDDGRLYCGSTVNAPAFYDSDNSAYYLDPNNTGTALNVAGSIVAAGNVTAYSDIRVKANIEPIHGALDKLSQINGVTYTRTDLDDKERRYGGVIAQEIEVVLPEAVFDNGDKKAVDYNATIGLLIEAIKEQQSQINELKLMVHQLRGN